MDYARRVEVQVQVQNHWRFIKDIAATSDYPVLEIGSGVGLTGIIASTRVPRIVLSDHQDVILDLINKNIDLNECKSLSKPQAGEVQQLRRLYISQHCCAHILVPYTHYTYIIQYNTYIDIYMYIYIYVYIYTNVQDIKHMQYAQDIYMYIYINVIGYAQYAYM